MKEFAVHVISVLVLLLLLSRLACLLLSAEICLITVNCIYTLRTIHFVLYAEA